MLYCGVADILCKIAISDHWNFQEEEPPALLECAKANYFRFPNIRAKYAEKKNCFCLL